MRLTPWTAVVALLLAGLPAGAAPPDASAPGGDEQTLQSVGLATDGPALLDFFRARARTETDAEQLRSLTRKLGDPSATTRERAAAELVAWGPLAVPVLRQAVNDLDSAEAAERARKCLQVLEGPGSATLPAAAARLLAARKPAGAAAVLLSYLPVSDSPAVLQEVSAALCAVAYTDGKPEDVLVRALKDPVPVRRAAAGLALYRPGQPELWRDVRKLLQDPKPAVRWRTALILAKAHDAEAIGVLIDLLADLSAEQRKEAEEVLQQLAGEWAPGPVTGEDEIARRIRRDTWAAWWRNTDGPALLAYLRKRVLTPDNQLKVAALIKKLGDDSFDVRERAQVDLVSMSRLTLPQLKEAYKDKDVEIARRAEECVRLIEKDPANVMPAAALRLLAVRRPAGAAEMLLDYLPYADNETIAAETQLALNAVAIRDGKADPALLEALPDKLALRRAAAGEALARSGLAEQRPAVRKLLTDDDRTVRLRVAVALVTARDKDAVPALIDLIAELSAEQQRQAEEVLYQLAGDKPPETTPGDDEETRKKNRDAWMAWWKENGAKVDLARLDGRPVWLGYTLVVDHQGRVFELGRDNKPRWQIDKLPHPIDAVVLPGNRVLIAEYSGMKVTERDFNGKVLWEKGGLPGNPFNVQRLPSGNTFIAHTGGIVEVDRAGKEVFVIHNNTGILAANKARDGSIWCLLGDGRCVRMDTSGKELKSIPLNQQPGTGGIDLLPNGGVLIAQPNANRVIEIDADGKIVWEAPAPQVYGVTRLPNGNVLAASYNNQRVFELDRKGKVVWEYKETVQPFRARRR